MEKQDSVLVILVQNLKGIVIVMNNVKKVSDADQTIAQHHLDLIQTMIAVMFQLLVMKVFAQVLTSVTLMKVTAILQMNVKAICFVDQTIALNHLAIQLQLTAVNQEVITLLPIIKHTRLSIEFILKFSITDRIMCNELLPRWV